MSSNYRPGDLRTSMPSGRISGLRPKGRVLAPEAFDPGQVVRESLFSGVVWSLAPVPGRGQDARWVLCEDGVIRLLVLSKGPEGELSFSSWGHAQWDIVPTGAQPFSVGAFEGEQPELPELPDQPSIFELALAA